MISRRTFLRLASAAATVAAADPASLALIDDGRFNNERLGLSLDKPEGWHFISAVDFHQASQRQQLADEDPELNEIFRNPDELPFLVLTKYPASHDELNPAITGWEEPLEPGFEADLDYHAAALQGFAHVLKGLRVNREPREVSLDGTSATRSEWEFLYQIDDGREWIVDVATLLVVRDDRTHTFHFMQGRVASTLAEQDLRFAETSLRYFALDGEGALT